MIKIVRERLGEVSLYVVAAIPLSGSVAAESAPSYPVVIRIAEASFNSGPTKIREQSGVDLCVLGVRSRGTTQVDGVLQVDLTESPREAALQLTFAGESVSTTTAREQSAVVRTVTTTTFHCRTPIKFDEVRGFTAGRTTVDVEIADVKRRISSTAPGLRGRVVRSVARRRIEEQSGHIRKVALEQANSRLSTSMAQRVQQRITAWNEQWTRLQSALRSQRWYVDMPKPFFASSDADFIVIFAADPHLVTRASQYGVRAELLPKLSEDSALEICLDRQWLKGSGRQDLLLSHLTAVPEGIVSFLLGDAPLTLDAGDKDHWYVLRFTRATTSP